MPLTAGTGAVSPGQTGREGRRLVLAEQLAGLAKASQAGGQAERERGGSCSLRPGEPSRRSR